MISFHSPSIESMWRFAGWRPGRSVSIESTVACLRSRGFDVSASAADFLREFGGLTGPLVGWSLVHEWIVDPVRCQRSGSWEELRAAETSLNCRLTPVVWMPTAILAATSDGGTAAIIPEESELEWHVRILRHRGSIADAVATFVMVRFVDWEFATTANPDFQTESRVETREEKGRRSSRFRLPIAGELLFWLYLAAFVLVSVGFVMLIGQYDFRWISAGAVGMLLCWPIQWRLHASRWACPGTLAGLDLLRRPGWGRVLQNCSYLDPKPEDEIDQSRHGTALRTEAIPEVWRIRSLFLDGENIDDAAIGRFKATAMLEELGLAHTLVTDACIDALLAMPRLKWVDLRQTQVSAAAGQRLQSRKNLAVLWNADPS